MPIPAHHAGFARSHPVKVVLLDRRAGLQLRASVAPHCRMHLTYAQQHVRSSSSEQNVITP